VRRLAACAILVVAFSRFAVAAASLPAELTDEEFWKLLTGLSENSGFFPSHNFLSNEESFQHVIPALKANVKPGGVYLGVGPEQNFTYIVALRPQMTFIVDIRHDNLLEHLLYKALIEISSDRADFISRLFSRPRPPGVGPKSTVQELFSSFATVQEDPELLRATEESVKKQLIEKHGFNLEALGENGIHFLLNAFRFGPGLTYRGPAGMSQNIGSRRLPTYADLMTQSDAAGKNQSYLASEDNFQFLQDLERRNLIVPIVGDFAGGKAIRMLAEYLKDHGATVTAFYVSNVEQYLFDQNDDWMKFYANAGMLPLDSTSTFIRSWFSGAFVGGRNVIRSTSALSPMQAAVEAFNNGTLRTYRDILDMSD
jgi:hypothetical protein